MARYRHKSEEDLVWNGIRRTITRTFDMAIADARERALNDMLAAAWEDYTVALKRGAVLELEAKYRSFADAVVKDIVVPLEISRADLAEG